MTTRRIGMVSAVVMSVLAVCGISNGECWWGEPVDWLVGDTPPVMGVVPAMPTTEDDVHFYWPTGVYGNSCLAETENGEPRMMFDSSGRWVLVAFCPPPPPPVGCLLWVLEPVCGLDVHLGQLGEGEWTIIRPDEVEMHFYVRAPRQQYYVNGTDGNDSNDGRSWETAFATIQKGIIEANDTDTVWVWPTVYNESIYFVDKAITVRSAGGAATIEANGLYGVSFYTDETKKSVLKNFVIRSSDTGIFVSTGAPTIENITVVDCGVGIEVDGGAEPNIVNCIFWNNGTDIWSWTARYSRLGGDMGLGNIDADPCFVDPCSGDYRLKSEGWRWDSWTELWTSDSVTSLCIDAGNPGYPLDEEPVTLPVDPNNEWGVNLRIDMGAYAGTAQASMGPHGWAYLGDLTNNRKVNRYDLYVFVEYWMISEERIASDLDRDGETDFRDLALLARDWAGVGLPCDMEPEFVIDPDVNNVGADVNTWSGQFLWGPYEYPWWHKVVADVSGMAGCEGTIRIRFVCVSDGARNSVNHTDSIVVGSPVALGSRAEGWRVTYDGSRIVYDVSIGAYGGVGENRDWKVCACDEMDNEVCTEVHTVGPPPPW